MLPYNSKITNEISIKIFYKSLFYLKFAILLIMGKYERTR